MVLTVSFVLSLVSRALLPPSPVDHLHQLDASVGASGPHDFAVRQQRIRLVRRKRPSHPAPNVRDDRPNAPLGGCETGGLLKVICPTSQVKCLRQNGTTGKSPSPGGGGSIANAMSNRGGVVFVFTPPRHAFRFAHSCRPSPPGEGKIFTPSGRSAAARSPGRPASPRSARHDRRAPDGARDRPAADALRW